MSCLIAGFRCYLEVTMEVAKRNMWTCFFSLSTTIRMYTRK